MFSEASWALVVHSFSLFAGLHKIPQNTNSQPDFSTTSGQCQVFGYESCLSYSSYSTAHKLSKNAMPVAAIYFSFHKKKVLHKAFFCYERSSLCFFFPNLLLGVAVSEKAAHLQRPKLSQACWQLWVINAVCATRTKTAHVIWWIRSIVQGLSRWHVNSNGNRNVRTWAPPRASFMQLLLVVLPRNLICTMLASCSSPCLE